MLDASRMTVEEFFAWHEHIDGRYELVDGHIVPHPDYVTTQGLAAPSNEHGAILANLSFELGSQMRPPCRVYVGSGTEVDRINANVPDLSVSCDSDDRSRKVLKNPSLVFEVLSPKTRRIDLGRKVIEYLAIRSLQAYVVIDGERRTVTAYRPDAGAQTFHENEDVALSDGIALSVGRLFV